MDKQKTVVILLILAILFSLASVIISLIVLNISFPNGVGSVQKTSSGSYAGKVGLYVEKALILVEVENEVW